MAPSPCSAVGPARDHQDHPSNQTDLGADSAVSRETAGGDRRHRRTWSKELRGWALCWVILEVGLLLRLGVIRTGSSSLVARFLSRGLEEQSQDRVAFACFEVWTGLWSCIQA